MARPRSGSSSRAPVSPRWPSAARPVPRPTTAPPSVPVTVWDPPAWVESLAAGDALIVVGRMRRRFYQRPGGVASRVDLEADYVGRARDRRKVDAALRKVYGALEAIS